MYEGKADRVIKMENENFINVGGLKGVPSLREEILKAILRDSKKILKKIFKL